MSDEIATGSLGTPGAGAATAGAGAAGAADPCALSYVCKYTPLEMFAGFGCEMRPFDEMPQDIDVSDHDIPVNLCGFGRSVLQSVFAGEVRELVLVNCCDVMRRCFEILKDEGCCDFLYLLDLPHCASSCAVQTFARNLKRLREAYAESTGRRFDLQACLDAFRPAKPQTQPYIGIYGVRAGRQLEQMVQEKTTLPVRNLTCVHSRDVVLDEPVTCEDDLWEPYAATLLGQPPCQRMATKAQRARLFDDPNLRGIVYHTIQFCDFYSMEYSELRQRSAIPMVKLETDYTLQSAGQLSTRITAFSEALGTTPTKGGPMQLSPGQYVAGLDSGSTTTDVVIMDADRNIVASAVLPTGGGAQNSAEKSLGVALDQAGIPREAVVRIVATGYGRDFVDDGDESITEITCHAKGANFLDPEVRTVIDIGGQDSKVICIDETGAVLNFTMNDKCAAGTGRFLEMMARTLDVSLEELAQLGATWDEEIKISSMCTVFAESEVVTLVAQNKPINDIVHGLNCSVAAKVASLAKRAKGAPVYMMTGGVANNLGVVHALEERLGAEIRVSPYAQLCGAIGAALFALEGR